MFTYLPLQIPLPYLNTTDTITCLIFTGAQTNNAWAINKSKILKLFFKLSTLLRTVRSRATCIHQTCWGIRYSWRNPWFEKFMKPAQLLRTGDSRRKAMHTMRRGCSKVGISNISATTHVQCVNYLTGMLAEGEIFSEMPALFALLE